MNKCDCHECDSSRHKNIVGIDTAMTLEEIDAAVERDYEEAATLRKIKPGKGEKMRNLVDTEYCRGFALATHKNLNSAAEQICCEAALFNPDSFDDGFFDGSVSASGELDLTPAMTPEEIEAAERNERIFKTAASMVDDKQISLAASLMGKKGGSRKSPAKTRACSKNGKKGGWPKGKPRPPRTAGGEAQGGAIWPK